MKKNIMTIIIMASALLNLILTILIVFSIVPAVNKSNTLVEKIASVVDLELEAKKAEEGDESVQDIEPLEVVYADKQNINLKPAPGGDEKPHYGIVESVKVYLNKNADDFDDLKTSISTTPTFVLDTVREVIAGYNIDTISEKAVGDDALVKIKELYKTKTITKITLGGYLSN